MNTPSEVDAVTTPGITARLRIVLIISSLGAGGAQRVIVFIANQWAAKGHHVTLITFDRSGGASFFPVHPNVSRVHLEVTMLRWKPFRGFNTVRQVFAIRRGLHEADPEIVISFIAKVNILTILASRRLNVPVIISDRVDPRTHALDPARRIFRRLLYPRASHLVAQTQTALSFFPRGVQRRGRVIPNPVPLPAPVTNGAPTGRAGCVVVAVGRLHEQKGFDLLLRAFAIVQPRHQDWTLEIWGEGEERGRLEQLVHELSLEAYVRLPGLTTRPYDVLRGADLFVMSSRREGFPNALCEAMASGLPVISADCPSGPGEIIRSGFDGVLVPPENVGELAAAMDRLMSNRTERDNLASRAPEVATRFSPAKVMADWDTLLQESLAEQR